MNLMTNPQPRAFVARKFGPLDFERFDHLSLASLGYREVGKVKIDCRFRLSKSRWGVLGEEYNPAGIMYMDLSFDQPGSCRLSSATVLVSLEEYIEESRGGVIFIGNTSSSLQVTDQYGPKQLSGEQKVMPVKKTYRVEPTVNVLGNGGGGVGVNTEKIINYTDRWVFTGQLLPVKTRRHNGVGGATYRTLKWELTENDLESRSVHAKSIHTGFTFRHEGKPFYIRVEIKGKLQKVTDRVKKYLKFPPHRQEKEASTLTLVDLGGRDRFDRRLDALADGLSRAMERENLVAVPMEIPDALPASFQDATRDTSASTNLENAISHGLQTLVQDTPAINPMLHRDRINSVPAPFLPGTAAILSIDPTLPTIENLSKALEVFPKSKKPERSTTEVPMTPFVEHSQQKGTIEERVKIKEKEVQKIQETLHQLSQFPAFLLFIQLLSIFLNLLWRKPSLRKMLSAKEGDGHNENANTTKRASHPVSTKRITAKERVTYSNDVGDTTRRRNMDFKRTESMAWQSR